MKITVYTRPNCGACTASKKWLSRDGAQFEEAAIDDRILSWAKASGITSAPVITITNDRDEIEDMWGGFVPHKLKDAVERYRAQAIANKYSHSKEN